MGSSAPALAHDPQTQPVLAFKQQQRENALTRRPERPLHNIAAGAPQTEPRELHAGDAECHAATSSSHSPLLPEMPA